MCLAFAAEANRLGEAASGEMRDGYFELAKSWSELATEIELMSRHHQAGSV